MLDELFADERRHIRVMNNVVDGGVESLLLRLFRSQWAPVQQRLRTPVMVILPALSIAVGPHRITVVRHGPADIGRACQGRCQAPASQDPREFLDGMLVVGRDGLSVAIYLTCAILMQQKSADGKKLDDLTRVILIGFGA